MTGRAGGALAGPEGGRKGCELRTTGRSLAESLGMGMLSAWSKCGLGRAASMAAAGIIAVTASMASLSGEAEARKRPGHPSSQSVKPPRAAQAGHARLARRMRTVPADTGAGNPRFASIVYDVKAGRTLAEMNADALRHPASITKVMTLYMLFEQLEAGRLTLDTQLPVSAYAAAQAPTKLGLRPGETLRVEDAIQGIVTRSANDAAVVVAEALGGTESNFAAMMTRKARSLGMSRTIYRNASGLPNNGQLTTARDLAILGVSIQDRFPRYSRYFPPRSFVSRGRGIPNHNRLLGRVEGVDGIKTGYTNASGFNLLSSVKRDDRQLVAVILGGTSGSSRDAAMQRMIEQWMPVAYAGNRQSRTQFASAAPAPIPAPAPEEAPQQIARLQPEAEAAPPPSPARIRPAVVAETPKPKAEAPVAAPIRLASAAPVALPPVSRPMEKATPAVEYSEQPGPVMRWVQGAAPVTAPASAPARTAEAAIPGPENTASVQIVRTKTFKVAEETGTIGDLVAQTQATREPVAARAQGPKEAPAPASTSMRSGWIIQIGATDSETAAKKLLEKARSTNHRSIVSAEPFTESVARNGSTLWRARFAGFEDQRQAQAACAALKSK